MMAMYDYAKHVNRDRLRAAERARLSTELRAARRRSSSPKPALDPAEWQVVWPSTDVTGATVTVVNAASGQSHTGRDPGDWDRALGQVVRQMEVGV